MIKKCSKLKVALILRSRVHLNGISLSSSCQFPNTKRYLYLHPYLQVEGLKWSNRLGMTLQVDSAAVYCHLLQEISRIDVFDLERNP